ncbi:MAG: LTA synthase family protein [Lachnospiraceae bacterium]|nr:LTA synthase family protein [Lachnospiraceae bacterium]
MDILIKLKQNRRRIVSFFLLFAVPIIIFYLMEFYTHNPFETMLPGIQCLNIIFFELVMALGLFIFKKGRIALWVEAVIFAIVGLVNYFVLDFRSAPVMPWDILSVKTAASVADNYNYRLDKQAAIVLALFALVLLVSSYCDISVTFIKLRVSGTLISFILLTVFVNYTQSNDCLYRFRLYDKLFTPTTMTYKDGTVVAFCMQLQYLFVEKPEGYSKERAEEILQEGLSQPYSDIESFQTALEAKNTPNIIVIMNEAFSDLNILGEFSSSEDYIPFVRSLLEGAENTQSGYLGVSVLGGNTANTEFEFLTGGTMAFLPQGSIPYQQYINGEMPSLASYLKELGYSTIALHPYGATGWHRHQVYPWLGFDSFLSLEDFTSPKQIRKYVSDESDYEKIIQLFEEKEAGKPLFLFNVTMQNHSSYTDAYTDFTPDVKVEGSDSFALSQYLSLLKVSDREIEKLVGYFQDQSERTLIVFFGDHQPTDSVVRDIWRLNDKSDQALSRKEQCLRYQVPFFIWANYDIEEITGMNTSPNYLGSLTLKAAGLPLSPLHEFLDRLRQDYPVLSSIEVQDARGTSYEIKEKEEELLKYAIVQYYLLMEERENGNE